MEWEMASKTVQEIGLWTFVVLVLFAITWQALRLLGLSIQKKLNGRLSIPSPEAPACPWSAELSEQWGSVRHDVARMRRQHDETQRLVDQGAFTCAWKGRDEVNALLTAIDKNTEAVTRMAVAYERSR